MADKLSTALKRNLVMINLFFLATGIITLYIGLTVQIAYDNDSLFWFPGFGLPPYVISLGILIILISLLGFYGALKENHLINVSFAVLMVIVLILQLAASISGFMLKDWVMEGVPAQVSHTMQYYELSSSNNELWDRVQTEFKCCGVNNATDWLSVLNTHTSLQVPMTCCSYRHYHWNEGFDCTVDNAFPAGCLAYIMNYMSSLMDAIAYGGAFLSMMQGLIMVTVIGSLWLVKVGRELAAK